MLTFRKPNSEKLLMAKDFQALRVLVFGHSKKKEGFNEFDKGKYLEAWAQPGAIKGGLNYYRAPVTDFYGEIKVPTLVLHGMV